MRTILEILASGDYVSGEAISRELGITRAAVWKRIRSLQAQGWEIISGGKRGYHLEPGDRLEPELWQHRLPTAYMGKGQVRYAPVVGSTNTECKLLAAAGAPGGSLCLAEQQDAGKGRLGRQWISPAGVGLWQSVLLRPKLSPTNAPMITLIAAMAMAQAVQETAAIDVRIKWPNDLVCGGKKLCGILLEASADPDTIEYVVVGVGLNVLPGAVPEDLQNKAASVAAFAQPPARRDILVHYLAALEKLLQQLEQGDFAGVFAAYRAASCTIGSRVRVSGAVELEGIAEDIDDTGALLVRTDDGVLHRVLSGDVSVRGMMGYV